MSVKLRAIAKIDGDQLKRALDMTGLGDADIGIIIEIKVGEAAITCESIQDAIACLEQLRPTAKSSAEDA